MLFFGISHVKILYVLIPVLYQVVDLLVVFSACGGIRSSSKLPVLTTYFPVLAKGFLGKGELFVASPLEDCLTRLTRLFYPSWSGWYLVSIFDSAAFLVNLFLCVNLAVNFLFPPFWIDVSPFVTFWLLFPKVPNRDSTSQKNEREKEFSSGSQETLKKSWIFRESKSWNFFMWNAHVQYIKWTRLAYQPLPTSWLPV